jgi:hypothetical protein
MKKRYTSPKLTVHGTVATLTQGASSANRDAPSGPNNTAFPPGS